MSKWTDDQVTSVLHRLEKDIRASLKETSLGWKVDKSLQSRESETFLDLCLDFEDLTLGVELDGNHQMFQIIRWIEGYDWVTDTVSQICDFIMETTTEPFPVCKYSSRHSLSLECASEAEGYVWVCKIHCYSQALGSLC